MVDAALDGWLTTGRFNDEFERLIAERIGVKRTQPIRFVGQPLALSALPFASERAQTWRRSDTAAAGFPTTINPILQNALVPVFRLEAAYLQPDTGIHRSAIGPRTRAIMLAHALGNL